MQAFVRDDFIRLPRNLVFCFSFVGSDLVLPCNWFAS